MKHNDKNIIDIKKYKDVLGYDLDKNLKFKIELRNGMDIYTKKNTDIKKIINFDIFKLRTKDENTFQYVDFKNTYYKNNFNTSKWIYNNQDETRKMIVFFDKNEEKSLSSIVFEAEMHSLILMNAKLKLLINDIKNVKKPVYKIYSKNKKMFYSSLIIPTKDNSAIVFMLLVRNKNVEWKMFLINDINDIVFTNSYLPKNEISFVNKVLSFYNIDTRTKNRFISDFNLIKAYNESNIILSEKFKRTFTDRFMFDIEYDYYTLYEDNKIIIFNKKNKNNSTYFKAKVELTKEEKYLYRLMINSLVNKEFDTETGKLDNSNEIYRDCKCILYNNYVAIKFNDMYILYDSNSKEYEMTKKRMEFFEKIS